MAASGSREPLAGRLGTARQQRCGGQTRELCTFAREMRLVGVARLGGNAREVAALAGGARKRCSRRTRASVLGE